MKKIVLFIMCASIFIIGSQYASAANQCQPNLSYMRTKLTTEMKDSQTLNESFIDAIKKAGSASALIALYAGQKMAYAETKESALASAKAVSSSSNPVGNGLCNSNDSSMVCEAIYGYYLADDAIKLSDATIKTAECYKLLGY